MSTKKFKAESKRLLDLMINSIYTNKEIFIRELVSNASDAIDKLYFRSLTDKSINLNRNDFKIEISVDKEKRLLTIEDNGCGMTEEELDQNLGTIARSGSLSFKEENDIKSVDVGEDKKDKKGNEDINIIGQFGVGFYSSFMVSDLVCVETKSVGSDKGYKWSSKGVDGYTIDECEKENVGTKITLHIKEDTDDNKYSEFLDKNYIETIIKKYSDYIRYPIIMEKEKQETNEETKEIKTIKQKETINSMVPIWKKNKRQVKKEEYNNFYMEKFHDFEEPLKVIHTSVEGQYKYDSLMYIPKHLPYDYYTNEYERGLQLYSSGVLVMDKCKELLPDYFGFVKGLVDSEDLSLNISREMLQQERSLKVIARNLENKIKSELEKMLKEDREKYEEFYSSFGLQLKYGTYNNFGMNKDKLKDLLMFVSSNDKKLTTLKEYVDRNKDKNDIKENVIYYACGETIDKIDMLPQVEMFKDKGYEVLYLTDRVDEFVFTVLREYDSFVFKNVSSDNVDISTYEEKTKLESENKANEEMFKIMKETLQNQVEAVRFTNRLKNHPVCLSSEGPISVEMEKTLNEMPNSQGIKAQTVLEININHKIADKLKDLKQNNVEELKNYTKILYNLARIIEGLPIENPTELNNLICDAMI